MRVSSSTRAMPSSVGLWAGAFAESLTLKRIADTGALRIGYVPDAPPLSFEDEDGNVVGYSIDLCRHIASAIRFSRNSGGSSASYRSAQVAAKSRLSSVRAVALSGKYVPHFKPGKDLRERVNESRHFPIKS